MRSARYVGPLGGMALAFGAGIAILAGAGVASADTDDSSAPSSSSSSTSSSSSCLFIGFSVVRLASEASAGATTATADDTSESTPSGGTKVDRKIHTKVDRSDHLTVPGRSEATTGRVSTKSALDEDEDDDADEGSSTKSRHHPLIRRRRRADRYRVDGLRFAGIGPCIHVDSVQPCDTTDFGCRVVADVQLPADSPDEVIVPAVARQEPFDYTLDIKVNRQRHHRHQHCAEILRLEQPADVHRHRRSGRRRKSQPRRDARETSHSCPTPPIRRRAAPINSAS